MENASRLSEENIKQTRILKGYYTESDGTMLPLILDDGSD
jgi:hypothetical protein